MQADSHPQRPQRGDRAARVPWSFVTLLLLLLGAGDLSLEARGIAWPPGPERAGLGDTELALGQLHCAACHAADATERARLEQREAPYLGEVGKRLTPAYLTRFIADPARAKPGTSMPQVFHALGREARDEKVESLVHYLVSLAGERQPLLEGGVEADHLEIERGRQLYHSVGCVACHQPYATVEDLTDRAYDPESPDDRVRLREPSVPHGDLAKMTTVGALARFLENPLRVRPSGRMPSLNLKAGEAEALAMYLLREQYEEQREKLAEKALVPGLNFTYFEGRVESLKDGLDEVEVKGTGVGPGFSIASRARSENFAFEFRGLLEVTEAGEYEFFTRSDDGSVLWIGDQLVVDNDGVHGPTERSGRIRLEKGQHPIRVAMFEHGGGEELSVQWKAPGGPKQAIPSDRLLHLGVPMRPLGEAPFTVDPRKASAGAEIFQTAGCASCHALGEKETVPSSVVAPGLASLAATATGGCLAKTPPVGAPRYDLVDGDRERLQSALAALKAPRKLDPKGQVLHDIAARNCLGCHERDGMGGPSERRQPWFTSTQGQVMGVEGSFPPPLSEVGAKLRPAWLREVLTRRGAVRPYMLVRMPQYGGTNVAHLVEAFQAADDPKPAAETVKAGLASAGHRLVGTDGMACVSCHSYGRYASLGVPALDLTTTRQRIKKPWFRRYMLDPQALRPGTRMPQYWTDGESARPDILEGRVDDQLEALWAYLSKGPRGRVPKGMKQVGGELVVQDEAVIYRHWITGVSSRTIAVGYPERLNLAFDAANPSLALIWQGSFLDARQHRNGRGTGTIGPLGEKVIRLPKGPALARLASPEAAWPKDEGKEAGISFKGYRLDAARRPAFFYEHSTGEKVTRVEDHFVDQFDDEGVTSFRRTLTFRGPAVPGLAFRAAEGSIEVVESPGSGEGFLVDQALFLKFEGVTPRLRTVGGRQELIVPIAIVPQAGGSEGELKIVEEIQW